MFCRISMQDADEFAHHARERGETPPPCEGNPTRAAPLPEPPRGNVLGRVVHHVVNLAWQERCACDPCERARLTSLLVQRIMQDEAPLPAVRALVEAP
jgi:hypothetical protein